MAKKPKTNYIQSENVAKTQDEAIPLQPQSNVENRVDTEPSIESVKAALRNAQIKVTFDEVRPAYEEICQQLVDGVLPKIDKAIPILEWYKKYIFPAFSVEQNIKYLKSCSQGHRWRAFFIKENGLATMQNTIRKYIDEDGEKE